MTKRESLQIKSFLLQREIPELGQEVPGSSPDAAKIPSDLDLKNFVLLMPPHIMRSIFKQRPESKAIVDAAMLRETQKSMSATEIALAQKKYNADRRPGTPLNPVLVRVTD